MRREMIGKLGAAGGVGDKLGLVGAGAAAAAPIATPRTM